MIDLARDRLGDAVPLHVHDLAHPLPFDDDSFDDVIASLVLRYLQDWTTPLAEMARVLRPGGRVIVSVNHPMVRAITHPDEDYFATREYSDEFEFAGRTVSLTMWHRPLQAITRAFTDAGFEIAAMEEPPPATDTPPRVPTVPMTTATWARTTSGLLATVGVFQAGLASGLPWGRASYGGAHHGVLPDRLRTVSAAAAVGYAALAAVVGSGAGSPTVRRRLLTGISAAMALSTVPNAASRSPLERWWAPVGVATSLAAWRARPETDRA